MTAQPPTLPASRATVRIRKIPHNQADITFRINTPELRPDS